MEQLKPLTNEQRQHWEEQLVQAELAYEKAMRMLGYQALRSNLQEMLADCEKESNV